MKLLPTTLLLGAFLATAGASPILPIPPVVKLSTGPITGITIGNMFSYLGVPYAQPPVGALRFKQPQPALPRMSTYPAITYQNACLQVLSIGTILLQGPSENLGFAEDCLYLNVYRSTAVRPNSAPLPVFIWIYGGGFSTGAGSVPAYTPDAFLADADAMDQPIIVVNFNYRVNSFGFLSTPETLPEDINPGLLDQREVFRWVQKEIAAFGGDPMKVTVGGESAGAISSGLHALFSDPSESLFRALIMDSGTALTGPVQSPALHEQPQSYLPPILAGTNCTHAPSPLECLRAAPVAVLSAATQTYLAGLPADVIGFLPSLGGYIAERASGVYQKQAALYPVITGTNLDEGTLFTPTTITNQTTSDAILLANILDPASTLSHFFPALHNVYPLSNDLWCPFGSPGALETVSPWWHRSAAIFTDAFFNAPRRSWLQYAPAGKKFSYLFNQTMSLSAVVPPYYGIFHASELVALYNKLTPTGIATLDTQLVAMGQDFRRSYINFINRMDPNGGGVATWPAYDPDNPVSKLITAANISTTVLDTFRKAQTDFLASLYEYMAT